MRIPLPTACAFLLILTSSTIAQKTSLSESIEKRSAASWDMARKIWEWAEPGYQEKRSSALLADALESAGFKVERGVGRIPTAFTATVGSGKPVLGILGEYDALPGLAQDAVPVRQLRAGSCGHACGHHLFGVASASACIALAEQIKVGKLSGTVRFYGCPAEEGGSAKAFMARDGLFEDCDAVLHWHPSSRNAAGDSSSLARMAVKFRFHGIASHAAGAPEKGRSALDAVELTNHATQLLREHTPEGTRIHHVITDGGGGAPNVVPEFAEVHYYVRHPRAEMVRKLYPRLVKCAQAGALATETRLEVAYVGGILEILPNATLAEVARANLERLNDLSYDEEEKQFALRIQATLSDPPPLGTLREVSDVSGRTGMGSTDVGDVSWVVPTVGFSTACWAPGTPAHSWQAVACGGTGIGRNGMQLAAKVLAATAWDLIQDPRRLAAAKAEHRRRLAGRKYETLLEPGQKPPLDYRDPPRRTAP